MRAAICGAAFLKRMFWLTKRHFALWKDVLHMVICQEFHAEHPCHHLLVFCMMQQNKHFNYCAPTYVIDSIYPNLKVPQVYTIYAYVKSSAAIYTGNLKVAMELWVEIVSQTVRVLFLYL